MKKTKKTIPFIFSILTFYSFISCSSLPFIHKKGGKKSSLESIIIVGTNDLHGALLPQSHEIRDKNSPLKAYYEIGGVAILSSYLNILKNEFKDHMIWLDAGDEFQGSIESNSEWGAPMVDFFNKQELTAAAIGNHEFDFGLERLKERMREAKYPYLAANIFEKDSNQLAAFPNTLPHLIIKAGSVKVGIIGLTTIETPTTTSTINIKTLRFENLKTATLREAKTLRNQGADVILLTAHAGSFCDHTSSSPTRLIRKPTDPQDNCKNTDEIVELLESIPAGTVDAVVSGHTHQVVHQWIANIPVIQGGMFGEYFNIIYLTYDKIKKQIITDETRIEGPIPVCSQFFENQGDCNGFIPAPKKGRGKWIPAKFHGKVITPDPRMQTWLNSISERTKTIKEKKLGFANKRIEHSRFTESPLGNIFTDAIRDVANADFAYINAGAIRAPLEAGPITYADIFRSSPFDNKIVTLKLSSQELTMILRVAESGSRGFGSISGLQLELIDPKEEAPFDHLTGDGLYEPWKVNRLLKISLENGEPLDPKKTYTLATIDFLITGGDDLKWAMDQIEAEKRAKYIEITPREALVRYIEKQKNLNFNESPFNDYHFPRLKFKKIEKSINFKKKKYHSNRKKKKHLYDNL